MVVRTSRPTLYVRQTLEDERVKALFAEKGDPVEVVQIQSAEQEIALAEVNPDGQYPVLVDQSLVVYGTALDEYIHERWPGPQLIPTDPKYRAYARMLANWIRSWYQLKHHDRVQQLGTVEAALNPTNKFFFGDQISIVDVALIPVLRQTDYAPATQHFAQYARRLTERKAA